MVTGCVKDSKQGTQPCLMNTFCQTVLPVVYVAAIYMASVVQAYEGTENESNDF
jgi:hypothetical protein